MNELVSIIVPAYNSGKYLKTCIDSLLSQTYRHIEVVIVDDGSTDNTSAICQEYSRTDERVRYFRKKNEGVSVARNYGIDRCEGEWLTFCDSDDWLASDAIEVCSRFFGNVDAVRFSLADHYENKIGYRKLPTGVSKEEYLGMVISRSCMVGVCGGAYKSRIVKTNHIEFDKTLKIGEDWHFLVRVIDKAKNVATLDDVLYHYRRVSENSCLNTMNTGKIMNGHQAYFLVADYITTQSLCGYQMQLRDAKVKIFIENIKSFARMKYPLSDSWKVMHKEENVRFLPSNREIMCSRVPFPQKFFAILFLSRVGRWLIMPAFRLYESFKMAY